MGMFDELRCKVDLPWQEASGFLWQTKSLGCELDNYEIREDGTLWHQEYDTEDHSDPNAEGMFRLAGMMARVNERWVQVRDFEGELEIHHLQEHQKAVNQWYSVVFWFREGIVRDKICRKRNSGIGT